MMIQDVLQRIDFADGEIVEYRVVGARLEMRFRDWREKLWDISFHDVAAVESYCFCAELGGARFDLDDGFAHRTAQSAGGEEETGLTCVSFDGASENRPVLRLLARGCEVVEH